MDIEQVLSAEDFITFDRGLLEMASSYGESLEAYLRSVLRVVIRHRAEQPTWQLLARIIAQAFETLPASFNRAWLLYAEPTASAAQSTDSSADSFGKVLHLLRYQIAELHRAAKTGTLDNRFRDGEIDVPAGQRWLNYAPATFLECATNGMSAGQTDTQCSWSALAAFLRLGQTCAQTSVIRLPAMAWITGAC